MVGWDLNAEPQSVKVRLKPQSYCSHHSVSIFLKMAHFQPLFLYFLLFDTIDCKLTFNIKFANDWIRTLDRWYWKGLLYQLSHNHCPCFPIILPLHIVASCKSSKF